MNRLITSTDIERAGFPWAMTDTLGPTLKQNSIIIVNSDISRGDGIHWLVIICHQGVCLVIDPLGPNNELPYRNLMEQSIKTQGWRIRYYSYKFQMPSSYHCGQFSILVARLARLMIKKNQYSHHHMIQQLTGLFGKTADVGDEAKLRKMW